ncbi:FecR domain-containing protein [Simiduia curdlanivorans]|uniref:FecR family protein n=1 Tax=Simiduia curdlanivorans TaxID=1492769 RepID=A0ABV8V135_9GAMM|nr:FecR domain-containing protein [Simiduia curdlanivorans]MDN3640488.1 FecR domain-containing protein [Simiduia curdlanivorans]
MIQLVHNNDIAQQASIWAERQADGLDAHQAQLLRQWLEADVCHRLAFKQAREDWLQVQVAVQNLMAAPSVQSLPVRASIVLDRPAEPVQRPWLRVASFAFCLFAMSFWILSPDVQTGIGEIKTVELQDGSKLTLNASSEVDIAFTEAERRLVLRSGEIFIDVAKNPDRPLIVETARGEARAVGTAFNVRLRDDAASVLVTEGLVDVTGKVGEPQRLAANQSIKLADQIGLINERRSEDVVAALAWREQRLFFSNVALAEFVEEMNRYSYQHMVIVDSELSSVRVGGAFSTGDTPAAVSMLEAGFAVKAVQLTPLLTLLYRSAPDAVE